MAKLRYAYYPGCASQEITKEANEATRKVAGVLGIELHDMPGANCCGAGLLTDYNHELMLALNFRSLRYSLLEVRPHKWLIIAIAWELALLAVLLQLSWVRDAFGIGMPTWNDVGFVVTLGLAILVSVEIVKVGLRLRSRRQQSQ